MSGIKTVLFDLDGTLVDTAPDMAAALDILCREENQPVLPYEKVRPVVSNGSIALIRLAFGDVEDQQRLDYLKQRYLDIYQKNICIDSTTFEGIDRVLEHLEHNGLNWGVVTNKPGWLTLPLMDRLRLVQRAATIVSGDTTNNSKPHPDPMHHACDEADSESDECLYVGDARRDIEAGKNAGMKTLVANYGYIDAGEDVNTWGADAIIEKPEEILLHL
ncbi:MAG: HAD-IA family hydrolase [Thiotrichales bacterium]|nr:MAG: HAD-IA family hydrolase [Thiotrichales bacterium]